MFPDVARSLSAYKPPETIVRPVATSWEDDSMIMRVTTGIDGRLERYVFQTFRHVESIERTENVCNRQWRRAYKYTCDRPGAQTLDPYRRVP